MTKPTIQDVVNAAVNAMTGSAEDSTELDVFGRGAEIRRHLTDAGFTPVEIEMWLGDCARAARHDAKQLDYLRLLAAGLGFSVDVNHGKKLIEIRPSRPMPIH